MSHKSDNNTRAYTSTVHSIQPKWDESVLYDVCQDQHRFWKISLNCKYFLKFLPLLFLLRCLCICVRPYITYTHTVKRTRRCTWEKSFEIPSLSAILKFRFWWKQQQQQAWQNKRTPILRDIIFKIIECHKFNQFNYGHNGSRRWMRWVWAMKIRFLLLLILLFKSFIIVIISDKWSSC